VYDLSTVEAIGTTVEDAIARGLDALNATRDQVTIVVLDPGGKASGGQRPREARVQLTLNAPEPPGPPAPQTSEPEPEERRVSSSPPDEIVQLGQTVLQDLIDRMQIKGTGTAHWAEAAAERDEQDGPPLVLDIHGDDLGVLIGRRGETLSALQYITRLIVSQKVNGNVNLVVDVESYKARRAQQLRQLALRMAERVASTRKPIALEPMPASERRVIHLTLREHPVVTTESVGRDENRKVTIILKSRRRS